MYSFNLYECPSPSYVVDSRLLEKNLSILKDIAERSGAKILLAQKAFSMFYFYPLVGKYLDGGAASGLFEARLAREELKGEVHTYSPAFKESEFSDIAEYSDHIVFNTLDQYERFGDIALEAGCSCGLRINPLHSTQEHAIYDPCAPGSRLGTRCDVLPETLPQGISGIHFHTLCEQGVEPLIETVSAVENQCAPLLSQVKWLNLGGGHHITKDDYDRESLVNLIKRLRATYDLEIYLEPGEAIALNAGYLVCSVLDVQQNGDITNVILDTSAACHMPDVIEMPYRAPLIGSGLPNEKRHTYRLGGPTCLSGDIIGDYSFDEPLKSGDRLCFSDMAIYTMVKNNTFNGMPLPQIVSIENDGKIKIVRVFEYDDFKCRLS